MRKSSIVMSVVLICAGLLLSYPCFTLSAKATSAAQVNGCYLGVFRDGAPQSMAFIKAFEKQTLKKPLMVMWYRDYSADFPAFECDNIYKYGAVPHIVWEPWIWGEEDRIKLNNIISGQWDDYIKKWASDAKAYKKMVFVRWGHEFNIEKYPWGIGQNGKDPAKYVKAYRHVHDIFTKVGVTNVKWIWCFNNYPNPDENWNDHELAYPGDAYVDWIGIDGYNWGNTQSWSSWQTFKDMLRDQIRETSKKHPEKPVMVAEFGCAEQGGNKAAWVKDILPALKVSMRQVKALVLFDIKKETDWRINSSEKSLAAYKSIFKDPYFLSSPAGIADVQASAAETRKMTAVAKKAATPITLDGSLAPFSSAAPIAMGDFSYLKEGSGWKGVKDLSAKIYLMWDENFFYMYAKVADSMPLVNSKKNGDIWNGDAIEVLFPGYQIGFGTGDGMSNKPSIWIWQKKKASAEGQIFVKKTTDPVGYILEAKVPWKDIGFLNPLEKRAVPFTIAVDDADQTWQREKQFVWSGDYMFYKDPDVWGELRFEE